MNFGTHLENYWIRQEESWTTLAAYRETGDKPDRSVNPHLLVAVAAPGTASARPGLAAVCLDQPHDSIDRSPVERGTAVSFARTADDFMWVGGNATIWSISVAMIVTFPNAPSAFELEIHFGNQPPKPIIHQSDSFHVTNLGMWNGNA